MGIRDCLISAAEQGAITRQEARELADRFDEMFGQARASMGDEAAAAAAKTRLEAELRAQALEERRQVLLADAARGRIVEYLRDYRDRNGNADALGAVLNLIEHYGFAGTSSVAGRSKAIVAMAHGALTDMLRTFRRTALTGRRMNRPMADDVMRELHGQATGSPEARGFADAAAAVSEQLRERFNAAGGAIEKLENWGWSHTHDPLALVRAGRERWRQFVRDRLAPERMRDPLTGEAPTPERVGQILDRVYDSIVTDGRAFRRPSGRPEGRGALANQRAEHRLLVFRDADSWLDYDQQFGRGDPIAAIFDRINTMARDIAALEVLGPNPTATVEWLKQVVAQETANRIAGRPSLARPLPSGAQAALDQVDYGAWRIETVWNEVRGGNAVQPGMAMGFGTVRNLLTSALLGSASILAASTDPFIDAAARRMSGLPVWGAVTATARGIRAGTREQAVRAGIVWDDFLHIMGDNARFAGQLGGAEWSKWLADRTLTLSGLNAITQARRHVFALDFMGAIADNAGRRLDELDPYLRRTLEGYGIDRTDWDVMRSTTPHVAGGGAGIIRPVDIAARADGPGLPDVQRILGLEGDEAAVQAQARAGLTRTAEKMLEMILGQSERAIPSGTARSRAMVGGAFTPGTFWGELARSGLMFKSFALSFTTLQIETVMREVHQFGVARGAGYAGAMAIGLTLGGGLSVLLKDVVAGRDPQDVTNPRFMLQALQTGGGFGLLGDFLFADTNRFGHGLAEQLTGPMLGAAWDLAKIPLQFVQREAVRRESQSPTNPGRQATNLLARYTPVLSSWWATRAGYRHVFLDQLQYLVDPQAHRAFAEQERRALRERGQEHWWRPGEVLPGRAPDPSRAIAGGLR